MEGLSAKVVEAIRSTRIHGCLLTHGVTRRLANNLFVVPIQEDDEIGRYTGRDRILEINDHERV